MPLVYSNSTAYCNRVVYSISTVYSNNVVHKSLAYSTYSSSTVYIVIILNTVM